MHQHRRHSCKQRVCVMKQIRKWQAWCECQVEHLDVSLMCSRRLQLTWWGKLVSAPGDYASSNQICFYVRKPVRPHCSKQSLRIGLDKNIQDISECQKAHRSQVLRPLIPCKICWIYHVGKNYVPRVGENNQDVLAHVEGWRKGSTYTTSIQPNR